MISEDGSDVTEAFLAYARPLVRGNVLVPTDEDDLPKFAYRKYQKECAAAHSFF